MTSFAETDSGDRFAQGVTSRLEVAAFVQFMTSLISIPQAARREDGAPIPSTLALFYLMIFSLLFQFHENFVYVA